MTLRLCSLTVAGLFLAHNSCFAQTLRLNRTQCRINAKLPEMIDWFAATPLARGGAYSISSARKLKILKNYCQLKLGMNPREVEVLLGSPDYEEAGFRNSGFRPDGSRDLEQRCVSHWGYYFKKTGENLADLNDAILILSFNSERKLTWAAPQNIPQLSAIGSPVD